jgi:hypothetical protein
MKHFEEEGSSLGWVGIPGTNPPEGNEPAHSNSDRIGEGQAVLAAPPGQIPDEFGSS